jgi:AraC-like DNA-binding protein
MLFEKGAGRQTQRNRDQTLGAGDAIVCDCAYPGEFNIIADSRHWSLKVPRRRIARLLPQVGQFAGTRLDRDPVARRLLFGYLATTREIDLDDGRASVLCGEHIIDLVSLALGAQGEAREVVEERSVRAMRRAAILREIEARAADPGLNADAVARRFGVTPRYLRLLLEQTGRSFSEHVLAKRLERAIALLCEPGREGRKVAEVAFACGFGDLSYFNRAFRRHFGETPSEARENLSRGLRDGRGR